MIVAQCQISGLAFSLQGFPGRNTAASLHPVCGLPLTVLNSQSVAEDASDNYLLLVGYVAKLVELGIITVRAPLSRGKFSARWLEQNIQSVAKIANWHSLNDGNNIANRLPRFVITKDCGADSFHAWLTECAEILEDMSLSYNPIRRANPDFGHAWHDVPDDSIPKIGEAIHLSGYKKYLHRSFVERALVNAEVYQSIARAVNAPKECNYSALVQARAMVLDFGLERTPEDATDKELILARLDRALLAKGGNLVGLMQRAEKAERDGKPFAIIEESQRIETPTAEPKPEDYPNRAAFIVALTRWKRNGKSK